MTPVTQPPETYQQWISCMRYLAEHPKDQHALDAAARGRMTGRPSEPFLARLSDTVSAMLTWHCRWFLRQLDGALAGGEPEMAVLLAARFRRDVEACLLYRRLSFLEDAYRRQLEDGFSNQLAAFWADLTVQLRRAARDTADPALEDVAYALGRFRPAAERRRSAAS